MDFELSEEHRILQAWAREFIRKTVSRQQMQELDERAEFPEELWQKMAAVGLHGVGIPEEYGGMGGDALTQALVAEELAYQINGTAVMWGITSFAGTKPIMHLGSPEQKAQYLPKIARGEIRFAFGATEPGGGTDVAGAMRTRARRTNGGFIINGQKMFCTGAHVADYICLLARTREDVSRPTDGISLFIVPARQASITINEVPCLGLRPVGSCAVFLEDVFVPEENLLGELDRGFQGVLETLNYERIMVGGVCLGISRAAMDDSIAYAKERHAFGRPIGEYQALQHYVADMAMRIEQATLLLRYSAWLQDTGRPAGLHATMAKTAAAETAVWCADRGIQIMGGYGYTKEYPMQRYWRDARINTIGPITSEVARNYIARQVGMPRSR